MLETQAYVNEENIDFYNFRADRRIKIHSDIRSRGPEIELNMTRLSVQKPNGTLCSSKPEIRTDCATRRLLKLVLELFSFPWPD